MIYSIHGVIKDKTNSTLIIGVGDIAYEVVVSGSTRDALPVGSELTIYTIVRIRANEGNIELYGFATKEEKQLFLLLTSVNKIGPKTAMNILSATTLPKLQSAISKKKVDFLTDVIGLSEKTATRIILEISKKIEHIGDADGLESDLELEEVLVSLGFQKKDVRYVIDKLEGTPHSTQDRLKLALKMLHTRQ